MTPHRPDGTGDLPELLTVAEVAAIMRLSTNTIGRWARDGKIPSITLPSGMYRFHRADIDAILRGETPASAA
jgi:excisionase family DNA binding protein